MLYWIISGIKMLADINSNLHYKHLLIGYGQNIINMYEKPNLVVIPPDVLTISVPSRSKPILKCDIPLKLIKNRIKFIPSGQTEAVQVNQMLLDEYKMDIDATIKIKDAPGAIKKHVLSSWCCCCPKSQIAQRILRHTE